MINKKHIAKVSIIITWLWGGLLGESYATFEVQLDEEGYLISTVPPNQIKKIEDMVMGMGLNRQKPNVKLGKALMKQLIKKHPNDPEVLRLKATILWKDGENTEQQFEVWKQCADLGCKWAVSRVIARISVESRIKWLAVKQEEGMRWASIKLNNYQAFFKPISRCQ